MLRVKASIVAAAVVLGALTLVPAPASAQTPDGQTPAEETACNGLTGTAYGLCTAYCEAMDCDGPFPAASGKACGKVYANFVSKTGGQVPPCVITCPCADAFAQVKQDAANAGFPTSSSCGVPFGAHWGGAAPGQGPYHVHAEGSATIVPFCTAWSADNLIKSAAPLSSAELAACQAIITSTCNAPQ
jgi:hypothetical protein